MSLRALNRVFRAAPKSSLSKSSVRHAHKEAKVKPVSRIFTNMGMDPVTQRKFFGDVSAYPVAVFVVGVAGMFVYFLTRQRRNPSVFVDVARRNDLGAPVDGTAQEFGTAYYDSKLRRALDNRQISVLPSVDLAMTTKRALNKMPTGAEAD